MVVTRPITAPIRTEGDVLAAEPGCDVVLVLFEVPLD